MNYLKKKEIAEIIKKFGTKIENISGYVAMNMLMDLWNKNILIKKTFGNFSMSSFQNSNNSRSTAELLQPLENIYIVVPVTQTGSQSHAVTFVHDLMFDSTQQFALKRNKKSFEWVFGSNIINMKNIIEIQPKKIKHLKVTGMKMIHQICYKRISTQSTERVLWTNMHSCIILRFILSWRYIGCQKGK